MNGIQGFLKSMGMGRLLGIIVGGLVSFALIYFLMAQMGSTPMMLLMSGLDEETSIKIQTELDQQNVKYETRSGGAIIMVEEDQAYRLRMQFAREGIANGSIVGYEIFDKTDTLGSTSFVQNVNRVRALEGELARTIMSINTIDAARVHLTIAKRELFQRDKETAKATVVLRSRGGRPDQATVLAIQHIVANSVAGLSPSHVTIADETGGLLASGNSQGGTFGGTSSIDEKVHSIEERTRQKVYQILSGVVPIGKARVQVQVDVERNRITEQSNIYDPDAQVTSQVETLEKTRETANGEGAPKTVSVANSLPGGNTDGETDEVTGASNMDKDIENQEKTTYLNSITQRTSVIEPGEIKRLSIAVNVDGNYTTDANGNRVYEKRSDEELEQLTRLIKGAVGYDEERGDQIEVISMEFAPIEVPDAIAEDSKVMGMSPAQMVEIAKTLIIGIIVLLLTVLVIRPLMKAVINPSSGGGQLALAGAGAAAGETAALPDGTVAGQLAPPADATADGGQPSTPQSRLESQIDIARVEGEVQGSSLKKVGEIVQNHPDESVAIIRNWLHNEE